MFLLSGRSGTDDGCIGGPLIGGLPEPVSGCDGVDGLLSDAFGVGLNGSLSLEGAGVVLSCFDLSFDSRSGVPFLEDVDQFHRW